MLLGVLVEACSGCSGIALVSGAPRNSESTKLEVRLLAARPLICNNSVSKLSAMHCTQKTGNSDSRDPITEQPCYEETVEFEVSMEEIQSKPAIMESRIGFQDFWV